MKVLVKNLIVKSYEILEHKEGIKELKVTLNKQKVDFHDFNDNSFNITYIDRKKNINKFLLEVDYNFGSNIIRTTMQNKYIISVFYIPNKLILI